MIKIPWNFRGIFLCGIKKWVLWWIFSFQYYIFSLYIIITDFGENVNTCYLSGYVLSAFLCKSARGAFFLYREGNLLKKKVPSLDPPSKKQLPRKSFAVVQKFAQPIYWKFFRGWGGGFFKKSPLKKTLNYNLPANNMVRRAMAYRFYMP